MALQTYTVGPAGFADPSGYYPPGSAYQTSSPAFVPAPGMSPTNAAAVTQYNACPFLGAALAQHIGTGPGIDQPAFPSINAQNISGSVAGVRGLGGL